MQLTVKNLKQNSHVFNDINSDDTVATFAEEVKKVFNYTDSVRLIYCGKILDHSKLLSEYFKEVNNGFVVCMPEKSKQTTTTSQSTEPTPQIEQVTQPVSTSSQQPSQNRPTVNQNPNLQRIQSSTTNTGSYSIDHIRAILLVFSRFVKVSPELFYMFSTNDVSFQSFILSPSFTTEVLTPLVESSTAVLNGLQNGTDIAVEIPIFGRSNNTTTTNHTTNNDNATTNDMSLFSDTPLSTPESHLTTLTEQDKQNIKDLCEFGFQENHVTRVYIMANRNKELAASMLYELSE